MGKTISVIGAGSWGTALAIVLNNNGNHVKMWSYFKEEVDVINNLRENNSKLPGVHIPNEIICSNDQEEILKDTDLIVMVVPSQTIRKTANDISKYINDNSIVVCCSKGLEEDTSKRLSTVINEEIPKSNVVVLSGPSHAEEVARNIPTTIVAASANINAAKYVQDIFISPNFRVYTNMDVIGVEIGGALKNSIALCAGISDGLKYGDNTKAALMTRGIAEIKRLGIAMGAKAETFSGLTGIGDLIVTCTSMHSRNRRAGILIGEGRTVSQAVDEVKMVVEGITTTKAGYKLSKDMNVDMPITCEAYEVLFNNKNPRLAVTDLMMRDRKYEHD